MGILSGHQGLRGFERFAASNEEELVKALGLKHGVPCYFTFRSVLVGLDNNLLVSKFIDWVKGYSAGQDDWIALDGKSISATSKDSHSSLQNFVSVVSAFGSKSGLVYGMESFENGKKCEPDALRELLGKLGLQGKVFTMDALHTQKNI